MVIYSILKTFNLVFGKKPSSVFLKLLLLSVIYNKLFLIPDSQSFSVPSYSTSIDQPKFGGFIMTSVRDIASSLGAMMILLEYVPGLYKAVAKSRLVTPKELAAYINNTEN
ncbi:MAG: hypothetical protein ACTHL3_01985 [Candidatus Nitrosocosmicus sp.]